jgi:hypothetical protein
MLFPVAAIPAKLATVTNSSLHSQMSTDWHVLLYLKFGLTFHPAQPSPQIPKSARLDAHLLQKLGNERRDLIEVGKVTSFAAGDMRNLAPPDRTLESFPRLNPDFDDE